MTKEELEKRTEELFIKSFDMRDNNPELSEIQFIIREVPLVVLDQFQNERNLKMMVIGEKLALQYIMRTDPFRLTVWIYSDKIISK